LKVELSRINDYLEWLKTKIKLDSRNAATRVVKRGEVYICHFGKNIGSEEEKTRPCVIIQNDSGNLRSPNTIVAPISNSFGTRAVTVPITGEYKYFHNGAEIKLSGYILLGNITTVSKARLENCIAQLTIEMEEVDKKIMTSLGIYKLYKDLADKNERDKRMIRQLLQKIHDLEMRIEKIDTSIEKSS
jgi:mRNA interferase MazF